MRRATQTRFVPEVPNPYSGSKAEGQVYTGKTVAHTVGVPTGPVTVGTTKTGKDGVTEHTANVSESGVTSQMPGAVEPK